MEKEETPVESGAKKMKCKTCHHHGGGGGSGAIYGLGVIGALFYFLQNANSLVTVIVGIGKAIFWPAILMYQLLSYLKL
jgi:hypothetical protein